MGYHHSSEKRKFDTQWSYLRKTYTASGLDEKAITALYEFDCQTFDNDRRFAKHTQGIPQHPFQDTGNEMGEDSTPLLSKFPDSLCTEITDAYGTIRINWLDQIENERLWEGISKLSPNDQRLLTLHFFYSYTITEIAQMQGITQANIGRKIIRIPWTRTPRCFSPYWAPLRSRNVKASPTMSYGAHGRPCGKVRSQ